MGSLFFSIFFLLKHALHFQENGKTNNNLFQQLIESNRELDCGKFNHSNGPESPRGIAYCLPMLLVDYHMALYNLDQVDCLSVAVQRPPKTRPFCQHFRFMNLISFLGKCISRKKDLIESFWDLSFVSSRDWDSSTNPTRFLIIFFLLKIAILIFLEKFRPFIRR